MTAVGLGQQGSEATGPRSTLCRAKYFVTFMRICIPMIPMAQRVGQQGSEAVGMGSNPAFTYIF